MFVVCYGVTWWLGEGKVCVGGVLWCEMVAW